MKKLLKKTNEKVNTVEAYLTKYEKCNLQAQYCSCGSQSAHKSLNNDRWDSAYKYANS